jgi:hypothetical protein
VKGRDVGSPAKTAKGWFNSHYTLETNTEEVIVSQPILPQKMEQTSKDAVTFNAASSPIANNVLSQHTPGIHDNRPSPVGDVSVHTTAEYIMTVKQRRVWWNGAPYLQFMATNAISTYV